MKYCNRCKNEQPKQNFVKSSTSKDGLYYYCKKCSKEVKTQHRKKPETMEKEKQYRQINSLKRNEYQKRYHLEKPEVNKKAKKNQKPKRKNERDNADEKYIRELIAKRSNIKFSEIPKNLIAVKQLQVLIHRHIRSQT